MTYNIVRAQGGLEAITEVIKAANPDLIALQEVDQKARRSDRVAQAEVLAQSLGLEFEFVAHRRVSGGETGVALLSRFPVRDAERVSVWGNELGMLSAVVDGPVGPLHVFVVHFHATDPADPTSKQQQLDARRELEADKVVLRATASPTPTLVLGDLNAEPGSPAYGLFSDHLRDACASGNLNTWPARAPKARLDYVWSSRHVVSMGCQVQVSSASEHLPVVAVLGLHEPK